MKYSGVAFVSILTGSVAACALAPSGYEFQPEPGALVEVTMDSTVGVVLDEIPESLRARAANHYLHKGDAFWRDRAQFQIRHSTYRLTYRNFYYEDKGMLALPPRALWNIDLDPIGARHVTIQGHDAVVIDYRLETTLLSDRDSPGEAERKLRRVGGVWKEPFSFPLDPEFLFQRTGYACMNEEGYPPRMVESENAWQLFDQDCTVEMPDEPSCHLTEFPDQSCKPALRRHAGRVNTHLRFERIAWNADKADEVRVAEDTNSDGPDLEVIGDGLLNNRIVWRYIEPDSCAIQEQSVGGPGWRRLLEFDASVRNVGRQPLTVGKAAPGAPFVNHNNFILSACHGHYHYNHYGDFSYDGLPVDKRAFCIEATDRYFNSEETPLVHPYSCDFQGIASGWGDTYIAGIEGNWIDITNMDIPAGGTWKNLRFRLNPDNFICEGTSVLDENGNQIFDPTDIIGENGKTVDRPRCEFVADHDENNFEKRRIHIPRDGGFITSPCTRSQAGPLRDCGWTEQAENRPCEPGSTVTLSCHTGPQAALQALRICENSSERGGVIACMFKEALATAIVGPVATPVTFACPMPRSLPNEPGGSYGYFAAAVLPTDPARQVTCQVVS